MNLKLGIKGDKTKDQSKRRLLKKGDTITCSDEKDALKVAHSLDQAGIEWDFDYSLKPKIQIIITKDEKETTE